MMPCFYRNNAQTAVDGKRLGLVAEAAERRPGISFAFQSGIDSWCCVSSYEYVHSLGTTQDAGKVFRRKLLNLLPFAQSHC